MSDCVRKESGICPIASGRCWIVPVRCLMVSGRCQMVYYKKDYGRRQRIMRYEI